MKWKDIAGIAGKAAPLIGGLLGGPAGAAVGGIVASALGTEDTPEAVHAALRADPQALAKVREAELTHKTELERLKLREGEMYLADMQSARSRDVELRAAGYRNVRADWMIGAAGLILIACLGTLIFLRADLPGEAVGIISTIAGIAGACLKDAFQFEFGSSRGSKNKDQTLSGLAAAMRPGP